MTTFTLFDDSNAPEASKSLLAKSKQNFGMIPNLHAVMAASPQLLEGYQKLHELFAQSGFSNDELTVVWQTINVEHRCHYCVPAHTGIAKQMEVDDGLIDALRNEEIVGDSKLEALRQFTLALVRGRGEVSQDQLEKFYGAGYEQKHVLMIILGVAQKVMSNYTNHIAQTPLDKPFDKFSWTPQEN
ncbi:carboxymuconolactone decarboxylase family protein [Pseudidiomarina aestuarii]|uniref:carboxymuconolactone decarboxylase family protein n=1 Tax=Pseudidiomarina aestuarii TaxID=624146 RepID=UPI003A97E22D